MPSADIKGRGSGGRAPKNAAQHTDRDAAKQKHRTVWIARWYDTTGQRRRKVLGSTRQLTKAAAQQELDQILGPINIHKEGIPDPILREYLDNTYFPFKRSKWKADSTKGSTEQRIETHLESLMSRRVSKLRREELQTLLISKARDEGLSFSVVDHLRWDMNAILEMARNDGIVSGNQAADLFTPSEAARPKKAVLTAKQVLLGLNVLELRPKLIVSLALLVGMRPGEILALRWPNVHKDHAEIDCRVYKGSVNSPKTNLSARRAAFPPCVQKDIDS